MLEADIQNASVGYHAQHHNNQNTPLGLLFAGVMPLRGTSETWCDTAFRVHFRGWWMWVSTLVCE